MAHSTANKLSDTNNVIDIHKPVEFTIDGRRHSSVRRKLTAAELLELAGLDPDRHELWEMRLYRPTPLRYRPADIVGIRMGARFVAIHHSIRDRAGVIDEAEL
jgi:hypothetical protein